MVMISQSRFSVPPALLSLRDVKKKADSPRRIASSSQIGQSLGG
jgi:hypothetical protein